MDTQQTDERIRSLYRENDARLDLSGFKQELAKQLPSPERKRRSPWLRPILVGALGVVILVALGFGINALMERLGGDEGVVVITDDSMSPGGSGTSSSAAGDSPTDSTVNGQRSVGVSESTPYGFDVRQPFIDHDATAALGDPAYKIVTTWVAIGNRQETPLAFNLSDLTLIDAYDGRFSRAEQPTEYYYTETVTPIWTPALEDTAVAPGDVLGGYVSWKVPWYVWPQTVLYSFTGQGGGGRGYGWQGLIFADLNSGNRYYLAIGKLLYRGVIQGSEAEPFRPDDPITVAEFAKMAVLADAPYNKATFSYPAGYMEEATKSGLESWGSKTATQALTRLEVALTVARIGSEELSSPPADYTLPFTDVPEGAKEELALLAYNGVISGTTESIFNPEAACSRGQASQMLALVLDSRYREEAKQATESIPSGATTTLIGFSSH